MDKSKKPSPKHLLPSFEGLSDEEINTLFSLAPIKRLEPDEILIKEGEASQKAYVILDGELRIARDLNGHADVLANLGKDSWIGEIAFTTPAPRAYSVIANGPARVLGLDKATLNALDAKTQLFFFKRLNGVASERISCLERREHDLAGKNKKLMEGIYALRSHDGESYQGSEMVQGVIKKVPRLPVFATTLAVRLLEEDVSASEIGEMVKQDPSLLGIVLKTVNSPYYGFQNKISDINHAVLLLGFNELHQLVITEGVRHTMPDTPFFQELQAHSVAVSQISFTLSQAAQVGKPSQVATIALLHDLGKGVTQLLKDQNPNLAFLLDALDSAQVGSLLLKAWNLPDIAWQTVEFQQYPEFAPLSKIPEEVLTNVAFLYVAHLCYGLLQGKKEQGLPTTFLDDYKRQLTWQKLSLAAIIRQHLLPGLKKKFNSLPASFRKMLTEFIKNAKSKNG
jgi:HD-like signal output (HDOD) protein